MMGWDGVGEAERVGEGSPLLDGDSRACGDGDARAAWVDMTWEDVGNGRCLMGIGIWSWFAGELVICRVPAFCCEGS